MPTGIRYRYAVIVLSFRLDQKSSLLVQAETLGVPIFGLRHAGSGSGIGDLFAFRDGVKRHICRLLFQRIC